MKNIYMVYLMSDNVSQDTHSMRFIGLARIGLNYMCDDTALHQLVVGLFNMDIKLMIIINIIMYNTQCRYILTNYDLLMQL